MGFSSRTAGPQDVPAVLPMMTRFNAHERIPFDAEVFRPRLLRLVSDPQLGGVLCFESDGAPAGYAIVTYGYDLEYGGRDAFLTELWIEPDLRGRGFGRLGLAAAELYAKSNGAHALHLLVRFDNDDAQSLYRSAGYETEPRAVMTKRL